MFSGLTLIHGRKLIRKQNAPAPKVFGGAGIKTKHTQRRN